jgi:hypothetical protein
VIVLTGAVGGLTASALSLQATGAWSPTETQGATVVAVAAAAASAATARGAFDRYRTDIRWRRWRGLAVSVAIALGSASATAALALLAGHVLRLGPTGRGALIGVAAVTALAGAILDAYSDQRVFSDRNSQTFLEHATANLLAEAIAAIDVAPHDLEVVLLLRARDLFHPSRAALRIVHTVCIGVTREHPNVIHEARQPAEAQDLNAPIWRCYREGESVAPAPGKPPHLLKSLFGSQVGILSDEALGIWAAPLRNDERQVIGVLALQTYSTFTSRGPTDLVFLPGVEFTAILVGPMIASDY